MKQGSFAIILEYGKVVHIEISIHSCWQSFSMGFKYHIYPHKMDQKCRNMYFLLMECIIIMHIAATCISPEPMAIFETVKEMSKDCLTQGHGAIQYLSLNWTFIYVLLGPVISRLLWTKLSWSFFYHWKTGYIWLKTTVLILWSQVKVVPAFAVELCTFSARLVIDLPPHPWYFLNPEPRGWSPVITGMALLQCSYPLTDLPMIKGHPTIPSLVSYGLAIISLLHFINKLYWMMYHSHNRKSKNGNIFTDAIMQCITVCITWNYLHINRLVPDAVLHVGYLSLCVPLINNKSVCCIVVACVGLIDIVKRTMTFIACLATSCLHFVTQMLELTTGFDSKLALVLVKCGVLITFIVRFHVNLLGLYALLMCAPYISYIYSYILCQILSHCVSIISNNVPGILFMAPMMNGDPGTSVQNGTPNHNENASNSSDKPIKRSNSEKPESDKPKKVSRKTPQTNGKHPAGEKCGPCFVWQHVGSIETEKIDHDCDKFRHLNVNDFKSARDYLASDSQSFDQCDMAKCMCHKCYSDFIRNKSASPSPSPYWARKRQSRLSQEIRTCVICETKESTMWSPSNWLTFGKIELVKTYFKEKLNGKEIKQGDLLCNTCFKHISNINTRENCSICHSKFHNYQFRPANQTNVQMAEYFSLEMGVDVCLTDNSLICLDCIATYNSQLPIEKRSSGPNQIMSEITQQFLLLFQTTSIVYMSQVKKEYIDKCIEQNLSKTRLPYFVKYFNNEVSQHAINSVCPDNRCGKMFYDSKVMNRETALYIYSLQSEVKQHKTLIDDLCKTTITTTKINELIQKQCKKFPSAGKFDFRSAFGNLDPQVGPLESGKLLLHEYLDEELVNFIYSCTVSENMKKKNSNQDSKDNVADKDQCTGTGCPESNKLYEHMVYLKIQMSIALLCNIYNPGVTFFQTALGIFVHMCGLRERGFRLLNMFGIVCSSKTIRDHGNYWARMRNAFDELKKVKTKVWRVTLDNLNFNMRFCKSFRDGGNKLLRMFNLITSQVCVSESHSDQSSQQAASAHNTSNSAVTLNDFTLNEHSPEGKEWGTFLSNLSHVFWERKGKDPKDQDMSYIAHMKKHVKKCWTPKTKVVFSTICECEAAREGDVADYLMQLKNDLHIGEVDGPNEIVLGGDQQTYALMQNLKQKHPEDYEWLYPVPGDWHFLKTYAETLRDMILDGGFVQCLQTMGVGKPESVHSWQDIHLYLLSIHEALLSYSMSNYACDSDIENSSSDNFMAWLHDKSSTQNNDEVYRFWVQFAHYLNYYFGYYIAIRSGNWNLRNACLKKIAPIFSAYGRSKYEKLAAQTISDTSKFPDHILEAFMNGEWTVSLKGHDFHNLALDECHECVINRRIKSMTYRPSYFRTVTLADFTAYADEVMERLEHHAFFYNKSTDKGGVDRVQPGSRASKVLKLMKDHKLLQHNARVLHNVFSVKKLNIHENKRKDLLSLESEGENRFLNYVKQCILHIEPKEKKRPRKMHTFSEKKVTNTAQTKALNLTSELLSLAYGLLDKHGVNIQQTYKYPLAICNESGAMRAAKKHKFKDAMLGIDGFRLMFVENCPFNLRVDTNNSREVIFDLLKYLHEAPSAAHVQTYEQLASHFYKKLVFTLGICRGASVVTLVVDKIAQLPPPRQLVHEGRGAAPVDLQCDSDANIYDLDAPYNKAQYEDDLKNPLKKMALIRLITNYIRYKAQQDLGEGKQVIIDTPTLPTPITITNGNVTNCILRSNSQGEADYAVWLHAAKSTCTEILVCGNDTDIFMYGLALMECQWFLGKHICVERKISNEYVDLNKGVAVISEHSELCKVKYPVCNILAIYIMSGCDYVERFEQVSALQFIRVFVGNVGLFSCSVNPEGLVNMVQDGEICRFDSININMALRFIATVYLSKYTRYFPDNDLTEIFTGLSKQNMETSYVKCLQRLGLKSESIKDLYMYLTLVRDVTSTLNAKSPRKEMLLMPTHSVLKYHLLRTQYVMHLALDSPMEESQHISEFQEFGWVKVGDHVRVKWDENVIQLPNIDNVSAKSKCTCQSGCDGSRKNACRSCFKMCKPCNVKCKCKGMCKNPHNLQGFCAKCKTGSHELNTSTQNDSVSTDIDTSDTFVNDTSADISANNTSAVDPFDELSSSSDEDIVSDGSCDSDNEFVNRRPREQLVYGENEEMMQEIGLEYDL